MECCLGQIPLWPFVLLFTTISLFYSLELSLSNYLSRYTHTKKKKINPSQKTHQLALGNTLKQQLVKEDINNAGWRETLAAPPLSC